MNTLLRSTLPLLLAAAIVLTPSLALAHCQIPCGIYDDHARVQAMFEDVTTVEKAVHQITALAGKSDPQSQNQLVRWVTNKEVHAEKIIRTISDYFLTQRVKSDQKDYVERLKKHHAVIVLAMKNKQQVDPALVEQLKKAVEALKAYYPHGHK